MSNTDTTQTHHTVAPAAPLRPEESINSYTARPDDVDQSDGPVGDPPPNEAPIEVGDMNEADAIASGYTDASGHAVSMAKQHDGTRPGPV